VFFIVSMGLILVIALALIITEVDDSLKDEWEAWERKQKW